MTSAGAPDVLEALLEARRARRSCVLATVVHFKGSTPRKPGAKMLVYDDGTIVGTIGGGAIEHLVVQSACEARFDSAPTLVERHLTHDLAMCCGGALTVLLEPQTYAPRLLLFGAGHVAQPTAHIATLAGFDVTVIDPRPEMANRERFPGVSKLLVDAPEDVLDDLPFNESDTFVVIVTHDHGLDEEVAAAVLRRPLRFLGVIGSSRKGAMFRKRLRARGLSDDAIAVMQIPVGTDIHAETAEEIAVSIVGGLIRARRGSRETETTGST